jgi:uncharacterized membrane protein
MEDFERELRQALERRPAPPGLKSKILQARLRTARSRNHAVLWQRLAASLVLAAVLGGGAEWQRRAQEERRQGEAARQQVMTALRITGHALNQMNTQLAAHDRAHE